LRLHLAANQRDLRIGLIQISQGYFGVEISGLPIFRRSCALEATNPNPILVWWPEHK
jgi:hypothetical protein